MIKAPTYDLTGGKRRVGMRATDAPKNSLLSVFRNPTGGFESQGTNKKMGTSDQSSGLTSRNGSLINFEDDEDDELSSTQAPSVTTSSQDARTRLQAPSHGAKVCDELDDGYHNVEDFLTPKQPGAESSQRSLSDDDTTPSGKLRSGDIKPTVWKSKFQTKEERRKETEIMLREKAEGRMNPQHIRGAGFNTEGVKKMVTRQLPGSGWDTGKVRKRASTYKSKATFGSQSRKSTQTKSSSDIDSEDERKKESKSESLNSSSAKSAGGFRDPTKLYALPEKKIEEEEGIVASSKAFRVPPSLPPKKDSQTRSDSTENDFPLSKPPGFKNPTEIYKLPKRKTPELAEPKPKPFINPFDMKHNNKHEKEELQSRPYNSDDSSDDGMDFKDLGKGDSRRRKESTAVGLMSNSDRVRKDDGIPSLDDAEFSISGSQSSSQVRHMDEISLVLQETKLRGQAKKRKAETKNPDICVICNEILPPGMLDAWRYDDGELRPIRMAEWAIICNKHKEARFQEQWNDEGYPVINWGELKNRVERHHQVLVDIITNKVASPFRDVLVSQHKETRGNAAMLLRKDVRLQYPGYYGPRGSSILLHEITARLGSLIGEAAKKDRLIGQGGISAFIQTVLVPEVGVRLIMEDMGVGEPAARKILDESQDLGEKLHFDDHMEDIYGENDGPWFDINAARVVAPEAEKKRRRFMDLRDSD